MRGSETVYIVRPGPEAWNGDPAPAEPDRAVEECVVWPGSTGEGADLVLNSLLNVWMPAGTDVLSSDRVRFRGELWSVVGRPGEYRSSGGEVKGVLAVLEATGEPDAEG